MADMGRPPFKVTVALRRQVEIAAGGGMAHEEIAVAIGCSRNTLEKHFEVELSEGANRRRLDVLQAMYRAAMKGNVAAAKAFLASPIAPSAPPPKPAEPEEKLGKKELADRAARTAADGTDWSDLLKKPGEAPTVQ